MTYTGSSCEDIYYNNPETGDKSGYYRINDKWTYCNIEEVNFAIRLAFITIYISPRVCTCTTITTATIISTMLPSCLPWCLRGWKRIVNINIGAGDDCPSGWRNETYTFSGDSYCRVSSDDYHMHTSDNFSTNRTKEMYGRVREYEKGKTIALQW